MHDTAHQHGIRKGRRKILIIPLILILASRNLFHDRIRFVATIVGIVFSVILVTVQLGLYVSCERMITAMIDRARADLWIVPTGAKSFEDTNLLDGQARFEHWPFLESPTSFPSSLVMRIGTSRTAEQLSFSPSDSIPIRLNFNHGI